MVTRRRVKKNIKEDPLVTTAVEASLWAKEHFNQVIVGVVVLVVVIGVIVFTANSRQGAEARSSRQLANALAMYQSGDMEAARTSFEQIHQRFGGRDAAIAHFFAAESQLRQGSLDGAKGNYDAYLEVSSKYPLFRGSALIGKSLCFEAQEDYPAAAVAMVEALEELSEDDPRYLDASFDAGRFFAKAKQGDEAARYFARVVERGDGELKHRASVAMALLEQ
ncbi:MAG: tetratricopeptide repeat protein [Candidatus Krumholzibacteriota bacterium]|nr:tetratricopeptide repeat protein [Candidatus Krumholzibacteriota bacterium]